MWLVGSHSRKRQERRDPTIWPPALSSLHYCPFLSSSLRKRAVDLRNGNFNEVPSKSGRVYACEHESTRECKCVYVHVCVGGRVSQQGFHLVPVNVKKDPWENHALGLRSQSPIQLWISVLKQSLRLHKMPWLSSGLSVTNVVIIIDIIILLILPATVPSGQHSRHTALKPRPPFSAGNTGHLGIGGWVLLTPGMVLNTLCTEDSVL